MRNGRAEHGSTLVVALITVLIVAIVTGHILMRVTGQLETAHRSVAWNEALTTAESAVDMAVADLTALLPDVRVNSTEGLVVGTSQMPASIISSLQVGQQKLGLAEGVVLKYSPTPLTHAGEGAAKQQAEVEIEVMPLSKLLSTGVLKIESGGSLLSNPLSSLSNGDLQLVQIRGRGIVGIPSRRADRNTLDSELRRATLIWDRKTRQRAGYPAVCREIQVLLKPVFPYQGAVTTTGEFTTPSAGVVFDSFNSAFTTTATSGRYDVTKRLQNGDVNVNDSRVTLGGTVYGDVRTSGANVVKNDRIKGSVDNDFQQPLPLVRTPTWQPVPLSPTEVTLLTTLRGGPAIAPARYKLSRVTGILQISAGTLAGNYAEIWVTGDVTGAIIVDPGVQVKFYVQGNVRLDANRLVNGSQRAANVQIYGLPSSDGIIREINLGLSDVCAAIYAPTHRVTLSGTGHFSGSITASRFSTDGAAQVHYDEALALNVGPLLRFEVASWTERSY